MRNSVSFVRTGTLPQQLSGPAADLIHFLHNVTVPYPVPMPGVVDPPMPMHF